MYYRKNKILIGCLALLLSMVIGYALFSDNIEINVTGETKGDLSYEITTMKGIDSDIKTSEMYAILNNYGTTGAETSFGSEVGIEDSSITSSGNTVTYSANFTAPEQSQYFTIKITNTGSIPFTIDQNSVKSVSTSKIGTITLSDGIAYTLEQLDEAWPGEGSGVVSQAHIKYAAYWVGFEKIYDVYVSKDVYTKMENKNSLVKIENGESVYLIIFLNWKDLNFKIMNKDAIGMDVTLEYNREIPIEQYID